MPHSNSSEDISFRAPERPNSRFDNRMVGLVLLLIVNVLWVLSSELLRFIFVEESFKRPFFVSWLKNSLLSIYLLRYLLTKKNTPNKVYKILDMDEFSCVDSLNVEGFETMTSSDSESPVVSVRGGAETEGELQRRVRFSQHREIRRMPSSEAAEAQQARRSYNPADCTISCSWTIQRNVKWTLFFFAPMWLVCSFTYQTALAFTSVSALNLISSSASLFVLVFAICIPVNGQRFTMLKAFLVTMNLGGVALVSQFSMDFFGALFAQISAIAYALYLTAYANYQDKYGKLDIDLMFGTMGVVTVLLGTPLLYLMDVTGLEELHPLPNANQVLSILAAGVFGTLLADYLWLMAAGMTDSLSAALSMTLSIPFSFLADTALRHRPPTVVQLIAAVPITLSFVGAAILEGKGTNVTARVQRIREDARQPEEDREGLLEGEESDD